jgi:hypothetical protein
MPIAAATKLVSDVATSVKRQFGDESGAQITDTDIIRWVNLGQLELTRQQKWNKTTTTTPSVANQDTYNLPGVNIISIEALFYNGVPLELRQFNEVQELILSKTGIGQPIQGGTPVLWYDWDDAVILYPPPTASGDTIKLYCVIQPATVTALTDALSLPDIYFQSLLNFVMQQAYELDDDWQGVTQKRTQLKSDLGEIESDYGSDRYYPTVVVMQEDM